VSDYEDRLAACNSEMDRVLNQCNHAVVGYLFNLHMIYHSFLSISFCYVSPQESRNALESQLNTQKAISSELEHKLQTHENTIDKLTISNQALQSEVKKCIFNPLLNFCSE
jgi:hypothetical protein